MLLCTLPQGDEMCVRGLSAHQKTVPGRYIAPSFNRQGGPID